MLPTVLSRRPTFVRRASTLACALLTLAACAEVPDGDGEPSDAGAAPTYTPASQLDAGSTYRPPSSTPGTPTTPVPSGSGGGSTPPPITVTTKGDAGLDGILTNLGELFTTNDAGVREVNHDAGTAPPPTGGGAWTLNSDSASECPAEPPPIPIIGGACVGIYFGCGWTNAAGEQYSCVCDWIHWLCI